CTPYARGINNRCGCGRLWRLLAACQHDSDTAEDQASGGDSQDLPWDGARRRRWSVRSRHERLAAAKALDASALHLRAACGANDRLRGHLAHLSPREDAHAYLPDAVVVVVGIAKHLDLVARGEDQMLVDNERRGRALARNGTDLRGIVVLDGVIASCVVRRTADVGQRVEVRIRQDTWR